jgi:hypothetical protein
LFTIGTAAGRIIDETGTVKLAGVYLSLADMSMLSKVFSAIFEIQEPGELWK